MTSKSKKDEPLAGYNLDDAGSDAESGSSVGSGSDAESDVGDVTDDASSIPSAGESDDDDATASVASGDMSDGEDAGAAAKSPVQNIQDVISKAADAVTSGAAQDAITELVSGSKKGKARGASTARKSRGKGVLESIASTTASLGMGLGLGGSEDEGGEGSDEYDTDEDDMDKKLKKFDSEVREEYLANFHPECMMQNYDEIYNLARVVRDDRGIIVDELHKTLPILTKYERTRVLGQRAKQINDGAMPFVKVPEGVIDGYLIALKELEEKKIPFIIRRPLPNRGSEYWHLEDLQVVN
jgi:DNA-directed RNA polymerase I, II, and III subunit RPABC2